MEKIRRHIVFYGRVQGVGFRYRAKYAADMYGVTGWVRNLDDGSVEMEAEGSEESIDKMILAVEKGRFVLIENISARNIPLEGGGGFYVR